MVKGRNICGIINEKTFYIRVQNKSTLYSCPLEVNKYFKKSMACFKCLLVNPSWEG